MKVENVRGQVGEGGTPRLRKAEACEKREEYEGMERMRGRSKKGITLFYEECTFCVFLNFLLKGR